MKRANEILSLKNLSALTITFSTPTLMTGLVLEVELVRRIVTLAVLSLEYSKTIIPLVIVSGSRVNSFF